MDQETDKSPKKGSKLLWIIIAVVIIAVALGVWMFTRGDDTETSTDTTKTASTAPKHADWLSLTSTKYNFKLYYPTTYTAIETTAKNVTLSKGTTIMADIYSTTLSTDSAGDLRAEVALHTDATKGYMTGGVETSTIAAGVTAKKVTGTFGANAGAQKNLHAGVQGCMVTFIKNDRLWVIDSYDAGDATAKTIFDDMITDLTFL